MYFGYLQNITVPKHCFFRSYMVLKWIANIIRTGAENVQWVIFISPGKPVKRTILR